MEKKIKAILDEDQFARYQELSLQREGARAVLRPDVSEKLNITEDQREAIHKLMEANRPQPPQGGPQDGPPDFEKMRAEMDKKNAELDKKIVALLTSGQKATWDKMLGKPFKFENRPMGGPGGPGGQGGFGGRGGGGQGGFGGAAGQGGQGGRGGGGN